MGGQKAMSGTDKRVAGVRTRITFYEEDNVDKREKFEAAVEADPNVGHAFGDSGRWVDGRDARALETVRELLLRAQSLANRVAHRQDDGRCEAAIGDVADALGILTSDLTDILTN